MFVNPCFELQNEIVSVLIELANSLHASNIRQLLLDVAKFWAAGGGEVGGSRTEGTRRATTFSCLGDTCLVLDSSFANSPAVAKRRLSIPEVTLSL